MPQDNRCEEMRQEIIELLRAQLEALADSSGLSDTQLEACYQRQERVRELREQLSLQESRQENRNEENWKEENWKPSDTTLPAQPSASLSLADDDSSVAHDHVAVA